MQIAQQVFIVTGGASGLGAATARRLAGMGGKVLIADVQDDAGQALAHAVQGRYVHCDVTREGDAAQAVAL
ncbi:MAG: SDR family NAD(P)-dependent oxidoreductase, partial [Thiomonas delicata]